MGYENGYTEIYEAMFGELFFFFFLFECWLDWFRLKPNDGQRVKPVQTLRGRTDRIQSLAFSPKDTFLAVGCIDGGFDLYDVKNQFKNLGLRPHSKRLYS